MSGDEDHNHNQPAPVQFSTSPPVDVHKPRRSLSPPPKLFGFSQLGLVTQEADTGLLGTYSSSLGDLSRIESRAGCKKTISPRWDRRNFAICYFFCFRKKSRTSRVHHIQRPCLDFEKMQQVNHCLVLYTEKFRVKFGQKETQRKFFSMSEYFEYL